MSTALMVAHFSSSELSILDENFKSVLADKNYLPNTAYSVAFSPDGNYLAIGHDDSPRLTIVNTSDWSVVTDTPSMAGTANGVAFSPTDSLRSVSGVVLDSSGNQAGRSLVLFHRNDVANSVHGSSDAITGQYLFRVATSQELCRIAFSDDVAEGDLYNDVIDRVIPQ